MNSCYSRRINPPGNRADDAGRAAHHAHAAMAPVADKNIIRPADRNSKCENEPAPVGQTPIAEGALGGRIRVEDARARELGDDAGGQVNLAHRRIIALHRVKLVALRVHRETKGATKDGVRGGTAVAYLALSWIALSAIARERSDDAVGWIHGADTIIRAVFDVESSIRTDGHLL